jgi:hypothetical protein
MTTMQRRRKAIVAAIMIALATAPGFLVLMMAGPVSAQFKSSGRGGGQKDQGEKKKPVDDGQYKSAIERLPDKKFDPWQNMR